MSCMSLKSSQIKPWTAELDGLDQLKKTFTYLRTIKNILITCWLAAERSLSFELLTPVPEGVSVNMRGPEKFVP